MGKRTEKIIVHSFVSGITRYGKTYYAKCNFARWQGAALFFNPKGKNEKVAGSVAASGKNSIGQIIGLLHDREKINFVLDGSLVDARKQVNYICEKLLGYDWSAAGGLLVVCDEVQDFSPQGDIKSGVLRLARMGLGLGIKCIFVAQRPADASNIIISQCEEKIFFSPSPEDRSWIGGKGYPLEDIEDRIGGRKYYFCRYFGGQLSAAEIL